MSRGPQPKVVTLIEKYGLDELGEELEEAWIGSRSQTSLRDLARTVNMEILENALAEKNGTDSFLDGELDNLYRLLTEDEVSSGAQAQARDQLSREGIDVDQLMEDFVSRQAVHTYLTSVRGVSPPESESADPTARLQTIQRIRTRLEKITHSILSDLASTGQLALGDINVFVTVSIHCERCGTQTTIDQFFEQRGCDCSGNK